MTSQSIYITSFFHSLKTFYKSQVSVFPYEFFFLVYTSRFPLKLSYRFAAITHFSTISNISIQRCLLLSTAQIFLEATVHESFEKMASKFFESFSGFLKKLVYSSYSVQKMLVTASEEMNSTADVISRTFHNFKYTKG